MNLPLPLIFDFTEQIFADHYSVRISVHGRAVVLAEDDGEISIYGLVPAGATGGGDTVPEAWAHFRNNFRLSMDQLADEAETFEDFETTFFELFDFEHDELEREWEAAVRRVQADDGSDLDLPAVENYPPRRVELRQIDLWKAPETPAESTSVAKSVTPLAA